MALMKTVKGQSLTFMMNGMNGMNGMHCITVKGAKGNVANITTYDVIQSN